MVIMGTSCAYDPNITKTADTYSQGYLDDNLYSYATTKRALYFGVKAYAEQFGLTYQTYIPTTLCGPNFDLNDKHFIFDLIRKIYWALHTGSEVVLWGDGHQKREVIYVKDAVKIMLNNQHRKNITLNLSTGHELTIREYADKIAKMIGYTGPILYDESKFVGVKTKQLVPNHDYQPTYLDFVLQEMIEYYEQSVNSLPSSC
jgi:GDP-L-fucose synthase